MEAVWFDLNEADRKRSAIEPLDEPADLADDQHEG